jgi:hypothetical protein
MLLRCQSRLERAAPRSSHSVGRERLRVDAGTPGRRIFLSGIQGASPKSGDCIINGLATVSAHCTDQRDGGVTKQ